MSTVMINLCRGKLTFKQKQKLVKEITDILSKVGLPKEGVHIIINEQPSENCSCGGILLSEKFPNEY